MNMTDKSGEGILVYSLGEPLFTGAKHYSKAVMEKAKYSLEMEPSGYVHFNADNKHLGVGGNTSWGATALPAYHSSARLPFKARSQPPANKAA